MFNLLDKVKLKHNGMLHGIVVEIQKSLKGRSIYVVKLTENTSNGYWGEELELVK